MATILGQHPQRRARRRSAGISAVLDVLDTLDRQGPVTLAQLSRETGVAKSTLHRVCLTMGQRGWITRDSGSGNIELGPRVAWLARAVPASVLTASFYAIARRLIELYNETTCLTMLDGCESVFVAKYETTHPVRLVTTVGSRLPAFASASGRVMLADLPEHEVEAMYGGRELVTPTGRRLDGLRELLGILDQARRHGFAENVDETALGLHCIAVAVGPPGHVAGAITLCVPTGRMNIDRRREMIRDLADAASHLAPPASNADLTPAASSQDLAPPASSADLATPASSQGLAPPASNADLAPPASSQRPHPPEVGAGLGSTP